MKTLTRDELLHYLEEAIVQETAVLQQQLIIAEYDKLSEKRKPQLLVEQDPPHPNLVKKAYPGANIDLESYKILSTYISFSVGAIVLGGVLALMGMGGRTCALIGLIALSPYLIMVVATYINNKNLEVAYQQKCAQYAEKEEQVRQLNASHRQNFDESMHQWKTANHEMHRHMEKPLAETQNLLRRFYEVDVIYPKYRTLPALTSIYEYLVTGRCDELAGPHGAYNLYEDEVRKDTVISQLNAVIKNLEQIRQNQYMLYQQVKAIQENNRAIASELQQIKGYTVATAKLTALNTYYAALNERNTRITMYYHL